MMAHASNSARSTATKIIVRNNTRLRAQGLPDEFGNKKQSSFGTTGGRVRTWFVTGCLFRLEGVAYRFAHKLL